MIVPIISAIDTCYYESNEKIYTRNGFCFKISNIVSDFNAEEFAKWMKDGYDHSPYKNYRDLAKAACATWMEQFSPSPLAGEGGSREAAEG